MNNESSARVDESPESYRWLRAHPDRRGGTAQLSIVDSSARRPSTHSNVNEEPKTLAQALIEQGIVPSDRMREALAVQDREGGFLGKILIDRGCFDENSLTIFLVKLCRIPHLNLVDYLIDEELFDHIPMEICVELRVMPIDRLGRNLTVGMVDPLDLKAREKIRKLCPDLRIKPILCAYSQFLRVVKKFLAVDQNESGVATYELSSPAPDNGASEKKEAPVGRPNGASEADAAPPPDVLHKTVRDLRDNMGSIYAVLARQVGLFHGLSSEEVAKIFSAGMVAQHGVGEAIFEEGGKTGELHLFLSGKVDIIDEGQTIDTIEAGGLLAARSTAIAVEPTSLIALSGASIKHWHETLGDATLSCAILDRLIHNAHTTAGGKYSG